MRSTTAFLSRRAFAWHLRSSSSSNNKTLLAPNNKFATAQRRAASTVAAGARRHASEIAGAAVTVCAAATGGACYVSSTRNASCENKFRGDRGNSPVVIPASPRESSSDEASTGSPYLHRNFVSRAAAAALPAVVNITVAVSQQTIFGVQQGISAGSGFVVRDDGLVVTNAHVVSQHGSASGTLTVTLNDGRRMRGRLLAMDRQSDVALVRIEQPGGAKKKLPTVKIGSSSSLKPGDFVVALGSPLNLTNSVTCGIVSNVARHGSEIGMVQHNAEYLQTDAAINVGNSGGPLVDLDGKVIGINTMKAQRADGISFALPIDSAWQVVRQLLKHGRVARPYVGFKMVAVVERVQRRHHRTDASSENDDDEDADAAAAKVKVVIAQIMPGSPAERAGVRAGDVILEFDGAPVRVIPDILARIGLDAPRDIPVKILRPPADSWGRPSILDLTITTEADHPH